jgi:hypothetical protein
MNQKRYLGLELSGAKNSKTTLATLEYYPKEEKVFLLDIHTGIGADENTHADDALIETILEHADEHPDMKIGVNVPTTLPPALICSKKGCAVDDPMSIPEVKWMKAFAARSKLNAPTKKKTSKRNARMKDFFTPYTQRPIELWLKHEVITKLPEKARFEIDEAMGGNKGPLTARMHFLKSYLKDYEIHEVLPKLTVALLMPELKLSIKTLRNHRQLEDGAEARQTIIEKMCDNLDIFIYDRDLKKLTQSLNAFDAFLCAYTVLLFDRDECVNPPKNFPIHSGWVRYPKSPLLDPNYSPDLENDEDEEES